LTNLLEKAENWLADFRPSPRTGLLIAFVFGVVVRMIPELLSYPYPIGFDTIYYAWKIGEGVVWAHWSGVFDSWLLYGVLIPLHGLLNADPFLLLKLTMPQLFGLNACAVYYVATKTLKWSPRKGLFAAGLFSFQVAALGISWHFYRNMLGLAVVLFTIPWILEEKADFKKLIVFSVLSVLAVFSHEYASVLLFAAVLGVVTSHFSRGKGREAAAILSATLPAAAVFLIGILLRFYPIHLAAEPNLLVAFQTQGHYSGPLFFMTEYLSVADTFQHYPTYFDLAASVGSLLVLLYAALLPLVFVGFFRQKILDVWTAILCVGAFGCLVVPFFALDFWNRWMFMLVYPLTLYAANGFVKILHSAMPAAFPLGRLGSLRVGKRAAKGLALVSVVSGFVFMTSPMFLDSGGVFALPTTVVYLPSTMRCNAVPLVDVDGVVEAFRWIDATMNGDSWLLAHDALFYWAKFSLDGQHTIVFFKNDVNLAIGLGVKAGCKRFLLVWWNRDIGWYGFTVPETFKPIYDADRISVFEYVV